MEGKRPILNRKNGIDEKKTSAPKGFLRPSSSLSSHLNNGSFHKEKNLWALIKKGDVTQGLQKSNLSGEKG